ncbi:glycosyltransferase family 2 protein [Salinibacter ruber]|uniref:glycosyltransferase family 2 protein n=1 Tax=Salinibacter ruber TaxID=146919 RepID=UPI002073C2F7|nr:glycosyltransferase family 2 protein [Salinibacter ruber]
MNPDVSVVIPTYNRKQYLQQAISSCFDGNDDLNVEVVVVDDGSSDGTRDYLQQLNNEHVHPIFQEHQGGQVARNHGMVEAQGKYIKFLDDDDWLATGGLATEAEALEDSGADVCCGGYKIVGPHEPRFRMTSSRPPNDFLAGVLEGTILTHPLSLTYSREVIDNVRWDPEIVGRQDVQFAVEVALKEPAHTWVSDVVAYMRNHEGPRQRKRGAKQTNLTRLHAEILLRAVRKLKSEGRLDQGRRRAAAKGLWTWAHILSAYDWSMFCRIYDAICEVNPKFYPDRGNVTLEKMDKILGPRLVERLMYPFRGW